MLDLEALIAKYLKVNELLLKFEEDQQVARDGICQSPSSSLLSSRMLLSASVKT
jgi:hypothetical protein